MVRLAGGRAHRLCGLYGGLVVAPPDYQQGDGFRIIYVHAPSAWMSLMVYTTMAIAAAIGLIWRIKVAHAVGCELRSHRRLVHVRRARHGLALGRADVGHLLGVGPAPDLRAVLLFLYLGYMGLRAAFDDVQRADRASAVLAIVGVVNVPIIHYSVEWWNSLHQTRVRHEARQAHDAARDALPLLLMLLGLHAAVRARCCSCACARRC